MVKRFTFSFELYFVNQFRKKFSASIYDNLSSILEHLGFVQIVPYEGWLVIFACEIYIG